MSLWLAAPAVWAQNSQPPAPAKPADDNPFPGDPGKAAPANSSSSNSGQSSGAAPAASKAAADNGNPFPGESSDAPIIPVDRPLDMDNPIPDAGSGASSSGADSANKDNSGDDRDPARSPDLPHGGPDSAGGSGDTDGFSSSRSGLGNMPAADDSEAKPGKTTKPKTREQLIKEDVDIGGFYLEQKNWKAAEARFASAFALNAEDEESVWGLAEAEQHLGLNAKAMEHLKLYLSYDPDGKHARAAHKALDGVEAAPAAAGTDAAKK